MRVFGLLFCVSLFVFDASVLVYLSSGAAAPWTPPFLCWLRAASPDTLGETKTWPGSGPRSGIAERTGMGP